MAIFLSFAALSNSAIKKTFHMHFNSRNVISPSKTWSNVIKNSAVHCDLSFSFGKVAPKAINKLSRNYFYDKITPTVEPIAASVNRTVGSNFIYTRG